MTSRRLVGARQGSSLRTLGVQIAGTGSDEGRRHASLCARARAINARNAPWHSRSRFGRALPRPSSHVSKWP